MATEKVYTPATIPDNPFPQEETVGTTIGTSGKEDTYSPATIKSLSFPRKIIAHETIGSALNTKSRKILAEFEFTEMGSIQIGKYVNGLSGDIRITPNGITARDQSGLTTFSLDGTTGNAVFKGEVQAADFVVIDETGLISLANFSMDSVIKVENNWYQVTSTTDVDILDMTLTTPNFVRSSRLFISIGCETYLDSVAGGDFAGEAQITLYIDNISQPTRLIQRGFRIGVDSSCLDRLSHANFQVCELGNGTHTLKLMGRVNNYNVGNTKFFVRNIKLSYLVMGS